jgi:hypothetical protein
MQLAFRENSFTEEKAFLQSQIRMLQVQNKYRKVPVEILVFKAELRVRIRKGSICSNRSQVIKKHSYFAKEKYCGIRVLSIPVLKIPVFY